MHRPSDDPVMARPGGTPAPRGVHVAALLVGVVLLAAGAVEWFLARDHMGLDAIVVAVALTIGGSLLATGAVVGRARAAEARRGAQLEVLQHAARRMGASLTAEDVGRAVVEETRRVIDYHNARVYILEQPDELIPVAFEGRVGAYEHVDLEILRTRVGQGFTGWVAKHRTAIRVDDAAGDPRGMAIPGTDDVDESMLVVPMEHEDRMLGVITLSKLGLRQFDDDDLRLLSILADQAATAYAGTSHVAETRRLAAELRQLLDMSSALSRSLNPVEVANLMAEHLARAVGADQAQISDWDRASGRLRTLGCHPPELRATIDDYYPLEGYPATCRVLEEGVIAVIDVEEPSADPAEVALLRQEGMRGLVMLPLVAKGEAIGLVELTSRGRPTSDAGRITIARTMAHEAAMALENARLYETARDLADRDPLTGFFNHRYLHQRLSEEVVRAVRHRRSLSVLMLDLDDFKVVNDTFGHVYGDGVLVHVAELIRGTLRASDVAARYGGDEFAIILPETAREEAAAVAGRILSAFAASPYVAGGRPPFAIGASMGIATHPGDGYSATDLIAVADLGLYDAKDGGGSRVASAPTEGSRGAAAGRAGTVRPAAPRRQGAGIAGRVTGVEVRSGDA